MKHIAIAADHTSGDAAAQHVLSQLLAIGVKLLENCQLPLQLLNPLAEPLILLGYLARFAGKLNGQSDLWICRTQEDSTHAIGWVRDWREGQRRGRLQ